MKEKVLFICITLFVLIIVYYAIALNNSDSYNKKFKGTPIGMKLDNLVLSWGEPDEKFIYEHYDGNIIYKYDKDLFYWDRYIFVFTPKDSTLISKHIDD